jgi:hypothetical protein
MLLIIIALILIVLFVITTAIHLEHKFKAIKAVVLVVIVLVIGSSIYTWVKNDNNDLNSPKGVANSIYLYIGWLGDMGETILDVSKSSIRTVGNVINGNQTNSRIFDGRK